MGHDPRERDVREVRIAKVDVSQVAAPEMDTAQRGAAEGRASKVAEREGLPIEGLMAKIVTGERLPVMTPVSHPHSVPRIPRPGPGQAGYSALVSGLVRSTAAGLIIGAASGVALRAWMRLVSTDPEFNWTGTGYIVGVFAVLGAMAGLVTAGRRLGWGWPLGAVRIVGVILSLGCFVAAGITMLPTIVPAALGWARSDWPRPIRAGLIVIAAGSAMVVILGTLDISVPRRVLALALYLPLCAVEAAMMSRLFAPNR